MWNPFRSRREAEDRQRALERETFIQTLAGLIETFADTQRASHDAVAELARASTAQAVALQDHLALFKVSSAPVSRTHRDADEYEAEMSRLGLDMKQQLEYVLAQTGDPEN